MAKTRAWKRRIFFDWRFVMTENRRAYRLAFILFWSILMYLFFKTYVVSVGVVTDKSMLPMLQEGSYFLVNKYIYHLARPKRGDIVVFRRGPYASRQYVKRIIGLEGETLLIRSGHVYLNGRRLTEPYAVGGTYPALGPYTIRKDTYFVLGDNRIVSEDSRHFGGVPLKNIEGKIKPGALFPSR
ncbi:MAG: signal peptidase I [Candidatus Methylomirabilales bacterium]